MPCKLTILEHDTRIESIPDSEGGRHFVRKEIPRMFRELQDGTIQELISGTWRASDGAPLRRGRVQ